jgi:hypothetical protein
MVGGGNGSSVSGSSQDQPYVGDSSVEESGLTLNYNTAKVDVYDSLQLKAYLTDIEGTVEWRSSNPEVATVNENGLVSALKEGTATITAKVGELEATCALTAVKSTIAPVMELSDTEVSLKVAGEYTVNIQTTWKGKEVSGVEYSWNYEVGVRGNMWHNRINTELSLFYIDCYNQQISAVSGYGRVTRNSGRTASYGLEASIGISPIDNLRLTASYGYTHATFTHYEIGDATSSVPGAYINYTGNYVPFAPMHSMSVGGAYTFEFAREHALTLAAHCNGNGLIYWTEDNSVSQPFYALLDATLTYKWRWIEVGLWGKNLTGTTYNTFYFETTNAENLARPNAFAQQGRPLTFGANIAFSF